MVLIAFPIGFVVLAVETISLAYEGGGLIFLGGKANWIFEDMVYLLNNPMLPDLNKWAVWLFGFGEAALIALLRGYFHWFPLHPIGLAFQHTFGLRLYWFSLFIVWIVKIILLRYGGGQSLHRRQTPVLRPGHRLCGRSSFFYGSGSDLVPRGGTPHARMVIANHRKPT